MGFETKKNCLSPEELQDRLTKAGVQPTAQRLAICRFVLCEADHPTAEEVKVWADKNFPKLSLATVYNTLNTLVRVGLVKELKFPHCDKVIYDNNTSSHFHFLDESSGKLFDVCPENVSLQMSLSGMQVREVDILLRGSLV